MAGDVYSVAPHIGRGGWSWYTGSAGWLYRLITGTLLGIHLEEGKRLRLAPNLPDAWEDFQVDYRHENTLYNIMFTRANEGGVLLDGVEIDGNIIPLMDDGKVHQVKVNTN